jgi:hypothetical protein
MKQLLFSILAIMVLSTAKAQTIPNYKDIKLETEKDFNEVADAAALQAVNYLFATPFDDKNLGRIQSAQYLIKWTGGTPAYEFVIDAAAIKFAKDDSDLLLMYLAAMTKFVLENKTEAKDKDKIRFAALKMVADYANDKKTTLK